jgi:hypothetical protein
MDWLCEARLNELLNTIDRRVNEINKIAVERVNQEMGVHYLAGYVKGCMSEIKNIIETTLMIASEKEAI